MIDWFVSAAVFGLLMCLRFTFEGSGDDRTAGAFLALMYVALGLRAGFARLERSLRK